MLNMTARNFNPESYAQSTGDLTSRKYRIMASTGFSNLNSSMRLTGRLPQLSRSFSSTKSAKLKLTTIEGTLSAMSQQLNELKSSTRVIIDRFSSLADTVIF